MEFISIILLVCGLIVLLLAGIPVGFALGLAGIASILTVGAQFLMQVPITLLKSLSDPVLIAIPLFVLMGEILYQGKVGQNLFEVANAWLGRIRGGTGVSAVFAYTFFAAIVGSSMASVLTIGKVAIPAMEQVRLFEAHNIRPDCSGWLAGNTYTAVAFLCLYIPRSPMPHQISYL